MEAAKEHLADVKTVRCKELAQEMYCSLDERSAYYVNDIRKFFFADDLPIEEALRVVELYEARSSSSGQQQAASLPVDRIRKVNGGYELTLGREGCSCAGKVVVVLRSFLWFTWLTVTEEPRVQCI